MNERRPVFGWEGIYEVSEDGKVFRVAESNSTFAGRELKPDTTNNGYLAVRLSFQNRQRKYSVHRLVAEAFLENPENLPMVNHKDCNKRNNYYSNLEWCTAKQNIQHAYEHGRFKTENTIKGHKQMAAKRSKAVIGTHLVTGEQVEFSSTAEAERNGFESGSISRCCQGVRKTHKGYEWRYKVIRKSFVVPRNSGDSK